MKETNMTFSIPKGYKGIRSDIKLQLNSNLCVITGLNGSGKTTLLKYIYEQHKDKKEIFFKTQKIEYFEDNRSYRRINSGRYRTSYENPSFDDVYQDIIDLFKRNNKDPYTHHYEIFSMLFDDNSILYEQGYIFLESLSTTTLSEFDYVDNIKHKLGVPTAEEIKKELIKKLNQEIKNNHNFKSPYKVGQTLYNKYKSNLIEPELKLQIDSMQEKTIKELKINYRKNSSIKDRYSFESYIYELVSNNSFSIESIVQQLARRIYEDAKANSSKTRTNKLWQELNIELQKYREKGQFNYEVIAPSIYSSHYEITFISSVDGKEVHFDSLSSGEKIIFELICYYFLSRNNSKNLKIIILDEFDANLNPALAEMYLDVVKEQFCKKGITTLLTTHSPATVVEVEPKDLFSVSIENGVQSITCANTQEGKKLILKKLAPNFVYYGEFGVLEHVLTDKNNVIILVEGKNDHKNFDSLKDKYTFIYGGGAGNAKNFLQCLKSIPFLQDGIKNKVVIALFDFDEEGRGSITEILGKRKCSESDKLVEKINNKKSLFVQDTDNIFLSMMTPPIEHNYQYEKSPFRHQELKKEGKIGVERQENLIKEIIMYKKKLS